jgi:succinate-semialdehyde dehydrogenase/glutarate-semialdehyde dehydrogenase
LDEVVYLLQDIIARKRIGDALDETTDLGPLAAKDQLKLLKAQVQDSIDKGARVICGGKKPSILKGAYFEPTIITGITRDMRVWLEEVFGPVLPVISFRTELEAITLANDTRYGLGGYIFTADADRFERVATALETCMISHNGLSYVRPQNFFGGCKMSGHGREHAKFGFAEVTQTKLIVRSKS